MKYLISILLFILAVIIFFIFNLKGIVIWESFLISSNPPVSNEISELLSNWRKN